MRELSLHLLDIAENSISSNAKNITISVLEDSNLDLLQMIIKDDGKGMNEEMVKQVTDPFITTRTTRKVGLGIPLLKAAAESCNGSFDIKSTPGLGTKLNVEFQRSHIDRMPLGDLVTTFLHLVVANPSIHWILNYSFNDKLFVFDDAPIKQELGEVPLSEPDILHFLRDMIKSGFTDVNPAYTQDQITINN